MTPDSVSSAPCIHCGKPMTADAVFCEQCGHKVDKAIPVPVASTAQVKVLEDEVEPDHGQVTPADAKHAEKLLERASNLLQKGDYQGATVAVRQSLSLVQSAAAYLLLSNILRAQGNADGARHAMEHARALAGEDSGLLKQVDHQANLLTSPNPGAAPAPLTASLDTPLPPVIPQAVPATPVSSAPPSERTAFVSAQEPLAQETTQPKPKLATWKLALALVAGFALTFFTIVFIRRGTPEPIVEPPAISTPAPQSALEPPAPEASAAPPAVAPDNTEGGEITSPAPDSDEPPAAVQPTTIPRPAARPSGGNPAPAIRPRPQTRPVAPPAALPPAPSDAGSGSSSGNGMLRVPSELPTPAAVDSPQVPTIRTPR